jgi:hypothetical protein
MVLMPALMGLPLMVALSLTIQINLKAYIEMVILGIIMALILGNRGFREYIKSMYSEDL